VINYTVEINMTTTTTTKRKKFMPKKNQTRIRETEYIRLRFDKALYTFLI